MPLYKYVNINSTTKLLVWKITESYEELAAAVPLKDACVMKMLKMKSEQHRKGFLAVRMLMQHIGYTDFDLTYTSGGRPVFADGNNISITHSYSFSAIIVSTGQVGIDIELRREKVITIAEKFLDAEFAYLDPTHLEAYMKMLIVIWGVKEAVYKMLSKPGLSFKQHIQVFTFNLADGQGTAHVVFDGEAAAYPYYFEEIEDFTLVYCLGDLIKQ